MKNMAMTAPANSMGHRVVTVASWALPGTVFALLPKCPACFAAYVVLWTGIGLSMPVATGLRWVLMAVCVASLGFLAFRRVRRSCCTGRNECARGTVLITETAGDTGTAETKRKSAT